MMKILILGAGPLPDETTGIRNAGGLRTLQFYESISSQKNSQILLITIEEQTKAKFEKSLIKKKDRHVKLSKELPDFEKKLKNNYKTFNPDVIIGVNTYPSYYASKIVNKSTPFWADLNGWAMAEIQAQAYVQNSNAFIPRIYKIERTILQRADKISTVSNNQKYAVLGELAFLGRLGKENYLHEFAVSIPNAIQKNRMVKLKKQQNVKWRDQIGEKAFIICHIGGYNAWLDEQTLFFGLENAIKANPEIHFVSTGGILKNIDESTYLKFQKRIENSAYKNNFHLLGWVKNQEIPQIYANAHCLINADHHCPETLTGARNRLTESLKYGLPIITTLGSEIAEEVAKYKAGLGVQNGDIKGLGEAILLMAENKLMRERFSQNTNNLLKEKYQLQYTARDLIKWLKDPQRAPDQGIRIELNNPHNLKALIKFIKQRGLTVFFKKVWQKIQ